MFEQGVEFAQNLDKEDSLAPFRNEFRIPQTIPEKDDIYLCGNSLGLLPKQTELYIQEELDSWSARAVRGHFHGPRPWMPYHDYLADGLAHIVGSSAEEVIAMNSLTVNIHLMMVSFFKPKGKKRKILIEDHAFPSDRFAVNSQLALHHLDPKENLIQFKPEAGNELIDEARLHEYIEKHADEIALILWPGIQYYSGQYFDLKALTALCKKHEIVVGLDLAHAVGNLPLSLSEWGVDFAVWCHYKYLNSGPGAVGGCFIHKEHAANTSMERLAGWWGFDKQKRFEMKNVDFSPIPTAEGWQLSNPPVISLACIRSSLDLVMKAGGMPRLREKSKRLTQYLWDSLENQLADHVKIITPKNADCRGAQLSLELKKSNKGPQVFNQLLDKGVTCDWRDPNVIRIAPTPMYNSFTDVFNFVQILKEIIHT